MAHGYDKLAYVIDIFGQENILSTRSILGFIYTLEGIKGLGIDPGPVLKRHGLDINNHSTHAAFFDYDLDGDLDVIVLTNSKIEIRNNSIFG